jgi:hypothetical protein
LRLRGMTALDMRTGTAKDLVAYRGRIEEDLGGRENLSTQYLTAAELIARETAYLNHIDAYLMGHDSVLTRNRRAILRERGAIVDRIARLLALVGLERRSRQVGSRAAALLRGPGEPSRTSEPQEALAEQPPSGSCALAPRRAHRGRRRGRRMMTRQEALRELCALVRGLPPGTAEERIGRAAERLAASENGDLLRSLLVEEGLRRLVEGAGGGR